MLGLVDDIDNLKKTVHILFLFVKWNWIELGVKALF